MRLVVELWDSRMLHGPGNRQDALLTTEFLPVMKNMVDVALDNWIKGEENGAIAVICGRIWPSPLRLFEFLYIFRPLTVF